MIMEVKNEVSKRLIIISRGQQLNYPDSVEAVAKLFKEERRGDGKLSPHTLHDDVLVTLWDRLTKDEKTEVTKYYPAWAREVLVYPGPNVKLKKGMDIVDTFTDNQGREWIFTASSIPYEAIGREKVGLFVDPNHIEVDFQRVVISAQPESVIIQTKFLQKSGWGIVDEATRIPSEADLYMAPIHKRRYLARSHGAGVRPLARYGPLYGFGRRGIIAGRTNDLPNAVALEIIEAHTKQDKLPKRD